MGPSPDPPSIRKKLSFCGKLFLFHIEIELFQRRKNGFKAYSINKRAESSFPKSTFVFIAIRKLALKEQF